MKMTTRLLSVAFGAGLIGMFAAGCAVTNSPQKPLNEPTVVPESTETPTVQVQTDPVVVKATGHNPIAHLSDLVALTNSIPGTRYVAYFTFELNDQTKQPFPVSSQLERMNFPMWTDVDLKCGYTDDNGQYREFVVSTVYEGFYVRGQNSESTASTNSPFVSVEIPATYKNSPDYRLNVRIDYTKYSSIAHFLYANGMEGVSFDNLQQANASYSRVKQQTEGYKYYNVFTQAPKTFVMKVDFGGINPAVHNENVKVQFSFRRRVGSMAGETGKVIAEDMQVWTPIFPHWVRTGYFNEFARGDVQ